MMLRLRYAIAAMPMPAISPDAAGATMLAAATRR